MEPLLEARLHCNGGSEGCLVDSGTPLPSNLPHHDLHYIPEAQKQVVLRISLRRMKEKDIMRATGMGQCTYTTACVIAGCRSHTTDDQRTHQHQKVDSENASRVLHLAVI